MGLSVGPLSALPVCPSWEWLLTRPRRPMPAMVPGWNHGNITRSKAEELLSRAGKDGSFLVRASESIPRAYALCVL